MQIGVLIPRVSLGGASEVAINQVRYFRKKGIDAYLLIMAPSKIRKNIDIPYKMLGIRAKIKVPISKTSLYVLLGIVWGFYLQDPGVEMIIAHGISSVAALRIKKKYNIPYITYVHHPNAFLHGMSLHKDEDVAILGSLVKFPLNLFWNRKKLAILDKKSIEESMYIIVNSNFTLNKVKQIYNNSKVRVCYPAIDDRFHEIFPDVSSKENILLFASRHVKQKGFHFIPSILSKVEDKVILVIAGKPTRLTRIVLEKLNSLGLRNRVIVRTNMSREELLDMYLRAKVLLFPAIREDFGLSPVEGMSTGAIPVAWKDGGGVEETIKDYKTGLLAKAYDIDDYVSKINLLLYDGKLYSKMVYEAKRFSRKFSWKRHVECILNVLEKTM